MKTVAMTGFTGGGGSLNHSSVTTIYKIKSARFLKNLYSLGTLLH